MCLICSRIEMIAKNQNPYFVRELRTGYVVLGDHQHFRGYTLFLGKNHITELDQLDREERNLFLSEMADVAEAVKVAFGADKMNCELLGNGDAHVHWHLFPRRSGDLGEYGHEGKGPVWWYPMELMYDEDKKPTANDLALMKQDLLNALEKIGV
ncbi:HIT family protein [uncultured Streptococcus sp.]|uniref:HIT family protein n=1 Tax=uncultured Streptococcus sp. TaxID=83427 RepID=UPI0027DE729C|nr:HIT family protein [uncultured Streptococcus sp.]